MLPQVKSTATSTTHHGVPAEGGLVGERAAAEATHVGLLSCVDALVPLEGIELGELLRAVFTAVRALAWQHAEREAGSVICTGRLSERTIYHLCVFLDADGGSSSERSSGCTACTCTVWSRCGCWSGVAGILWMQSSSRRPHT